MLYHPGQSPSVRLAVVMSHSQQHRHHLPASSQSWPASSTPPNTRARLDLPTPCSPRRTTLYTWDSASLPVEMTESEESDAQLPRCCSSWEKDAQRRRLDSSSVWPVWGTVERRSRSSTGMLLRWRFGIFMGKGMLPLLLSMFRNLSPLFRVIARQAGLWRQTRTCVNVCAHSDNEDEVIQASDHLHNVIKTEVARITVDQKLVRIFINTKKQIRHRAHRTLESKNTYWCWRLIQ